MLFSFQMLSRGQQKTLFVTEIEINVLNELPWAFGSDFQSSTLL